MGLSAALHVCSNPLGQHQGSCALHQAPFSSESPLPVVTVVVVVHADPFLNLFLPIPTLPPPSVFPSSCSFLLSNEQSEAAYTAAPVGPVAPKQAKAMLRFSPMGNVRPMMATESGMTNAGPIPRNSRQVLDQSRWVGGTEAGEETRDQRLNHARLNRPRRRAPVSVDAAESSCEVVSCQSMAILVWPGIRLNWNI